MYILDTDLLSILQCQAGQAYEILFAHLDTRLSIEDVTTTIVTFQEQVQGWMARLNRSRGDQDIVHAYAQLQAVQDSFCRIGIVPFDQQAQEYFTTLRQQKIRIGTLDLRIAAIALANDAVLLTRNLRDFKQVPGLKVEDWTLA